MSTSETQVAFGPLRHATELYPGVIVSILLALAAFALSEHYGAPVMLFALLLGMAVNFLGDAEIRLALTRAVVVYSSHGQCQFLRVDRQ